MDSSSDSDSEESCQNVNPLSVPLGVDMGCPTGERDPAEEQTDIHVDMSSDSDDSSDESTTVETKRPRIGETVRELDLDFTLQLSDMEKQIVGKTLAMICRSTISDWNETFDSPRRDFMHLRELFTIHDAYKNVELRCEIKVKLLHVIETKVIVCYISYLLENTSQWNEDIVTLWSLDNDDDEFIVFKEFTTSSWFFFEKKDTKRLSVFPRDTREDNWCYFQDARSHLNRICFQ
jgi:hypothetical protein